MKVKWYRKDGRTIIANDAPGAAEALRKDGWRQTPADEWNDSDSVAGNELDATKKSLENEKAATKKLVADVAELTSMFKEMSKANDGLIDENKALKAQVEELTEELTKPKSKGK